MGLFNRKKWEKCGNAWAGAAIRSQLEMLTPAPDDIDLRDRDYRAISQKDFEQLLFDCWFPNDEPAYKSEIFDCDNFTVQCMAAVQLRWAKKSHGKEALAFGYVSANVEGMGQHAFIWHMDSAGVIRYYEPQSTSNTPAAYKLLSIRLMES